MTLRDLQQQHADVLRRYHEGKLSKTTAVLMIRALKAAKRENLKRHGGQLKLDEDKTRECDGPHVGSTWICGCSIPNCKTCEIKMTNVSFD